MKKTMEPKEMTPEKAAKLLLNAWNRGMGTFDDSPVCAIWHDGTQVQLMTWREFHLAVMRLADHHGLFTRVPQPDEEI